MRELDAAAAEDAAAAKIAPSSDLFDTFSADIVFDISGENDAKNQHKIAPDITAIASPGHTRDTSSYYFDSIGLLMATETTGVISGTEIDPTFITSYTQSLEAIEQIKEIAPPFILSPHHGIIFGADAKAFPERAKEANERFANFVMKRFNSGKTEAEIMQDYLDEYYDKLIKPTGKQPLAAVIANAEAMIPRLIAELSS
jgi:glyoxylase-like metal-dependent hydrolase (beta-lactamase superfamily II)